MSVTILSMASTLTEIECINPATGAVIGKIDNMGAAEVAEAVARARGAFAHWGSLSLVDRLDYVRSVRDGLVASTESLCELICDETGKIYNEALINEFLVTAELIDFYLKHAPRILGKHRADPGLLKNKKAYKTYSPLGVVGVISPWNYPYSLSLGPTITALVAGNTVVLKPSEITPLIAIESQKIFAREGYPDIFQVVTGDGGTGAALVTSGVDKICFTGSVATGKKVMASAAETLTPVILELGGKDAMVVAEDADLDRASNAATWGAFTNAGQTCIAVERVYAVAPVYDRFVEKVVAKTKSLVPGKDMGFMTFPPQMEIVKRHVADAVAKGATILTGGSSDGMFHEPTVLVDVDHSMDIMTEETFGPVLPIMKVTSLDEALEKANDSKYGLSASVFAGSSEVKKLASERLDAGSVCVNDCLVAFGVASLPFGGVKESGMGRSHGEEGLLEFSKVKSVVSDITGLKSDPQWFPNKLMSPTVIKKLMRFRYGKSIAQKVKGAIGS